MKINNIIDEGNGKLAEFVRSLVGRNKIPEEQREAEEMRLRDLIAEKVIAETLAALPDEDLDEIEKELDEKGELSVEKWNSMMFVEGIRPESIVGKVFREVERDYLGAENVEDEEYLIATQEEQ